MISYFGTYHWSKNTVQGCQNTIQGYKIVFDTLFLITPIGIALRMEKTGDFDPAEGRMGIQ